MAFPAALSVKCLCDDTDLQRLISSRLTSAPCSLNCANFVEFPVCVTK